MELQVLVSASKQNDLAELVKRNKIDKNDNYIIVNQLASKYKEDVFGNIKMYSYDEKGLSKSRNRLIEFASGDIGIICDDDVIMENDYKAIIEKAYIDNPTADVIVFNSRVGDRVVGNNKYRKHNFFSVMSVMSIQVTFKINKIKKNNICFDTDFGLGAKYKGGEENIFLVDCLKKKLKIIHVPIIINTHPTITSNEIWNEDTIRAKGAFSHKVLGNLSILFLLYFAFVKYKEYKEDFKMSKFIKIFNEGKKRYKDSK